MFRKIAAAALAGTLAIAAIGLSTPAAAQGRSQSANRGNDNRNGLDFGVGALFGFGLGAALGQPYYGQPYYGWGNPYPNYRPPYPAYRPPQPPVAFYSPYPVYPGYPPRPVFSGNWSAHVAWCEARYRSYTAATNTYNIRIGVPAVCRSPYG